MAVHGRPADYVLRIVSHACRKPFLVQRHVCRAGRLHRSSHVACMLCARYPISAMQKRGSSTDFLRWQFLSYYQDGYGIPTWHGVRSCIRTDHQRGANVVNASFYSFHHFYHFHVTRYPLQTFAGRSCWHNTIEYEHRKNFKDDDEKRSPCSYVCCAPRRDPQLVGRSPHQEIEVAAFEAA